MRSRSSGPAGRCDWVDVNGALMLHEDGASEAETRAYLERWGLVTPERSATHLIRFLREPTSRSYILTYAAGQELCERWVRGDLERFARLLTEQVRVGELLEGELGRDLDRRLRRGEQVAHADPR